MPGGEHVAVISHAYWQQRFRGDESVIGRSIKLNNITHTIVGVLDREFQFPWDETSAWTSLQTYPADVFSRTAHSVFGIGRLRPGVALETARRDLDAIQSRIAAEYPDLSNWSQTSSNRCERS